MGTYLIVVCLYAIALMVTSGLVQDTDQGQRPRVRFHLEFIRSRWKGVVFLSAKILGLCFVGALLLGVAAIRTGRLLGGAGPIANGVVVVFITYALVAFLVIPAALRLIQEAPAPLSPQTVRDVRWLAMLPLAASAAIGYFDAVGIGSIRGLGSPTHTFARVVTQTAGSLLVALPYALLFVLLSLAAIEGRDSSTEPVIDM